MAPWEKEEKSDLVPSHKGADGESDGVERQVEGRGKQGLDFGGGLS